MREAAAIAANALPAAEAAFSAATEDLARARAERRRIDVEQGEFEKRIALLTRQSGDIAEELAKLEASSGGETNLVALNADLARLSGLVETLEAELAASEAGEEAAQAREAESRAAAASAKLHVQELHTELATLLKLLKPAEAGAWMPIVDEIRIASGYEQALGASLGDDLDAAGDEAAPSHWRLVPSEGDPELPEGAIALSQFVSGPPALKRRLAQIGVVERTQGKALQARLKPGQRLVSTEGDLWRWDGYTVAAGTASAAGARLVERSRLEALKAEAERAEATLQDAEAEAATLAGNAHAAIEATKALRLKVRQARDELGRTRDAIAATEHESLANSKQLGALAEAKSRTLVGLDEARRALARTLSARLELAALDVLEAVLERAHADAAEKRSAHARAEAAVQGFEREVRLRQERLEAISAEQELWQNRIAKAREQIETLRAREAETRADLTALANLPAEIEQRRGRLLDAITAAERERGKAADDLGDRRDRAQAPRESLARGAGEARRRARGAGAEPGAARIGARAAERDRPRHSRAARLRAGSLSCACRHEARHIPSPHSPRSRGRLLKLRGERERLGGVNLRAEEEEADISTRLEEMEREKADVEQAIARLRQGISNLNREGRKRLLEAFDSVNAHFQRLFQTLFGGGTAELQLVDSDDPLESGLEIIACPPGKRPQVLTLLSGGEKALTALALIFAVFLTNPSPICVLDEVDAPLDDANVERFCLLMEEMAKETDTRFLIITHHPLTMSRMSRLFGVTMAERGVSQLVSVDLETAERLRDAS